MNAENNAINARGWVVESCFAWQDILTRVDRRQEQFFGTFRAMLFFSVSCLACIVQRSLELQNEPTTFDLRETFSPWGINATLKKSIAFKSS